MIRPRVTRRLVAAWLFDKDPYISDKELNEALKDVEVPHDRFVRKDGSHYRNLKNRGRLPPVPDSDPRTW